MISRTKWSLMDSWSGNRWCQQVIASLGCRGQDGCIIWDKYTCLRYNHTLRPFFDSTARQRRSQFKNWGMWNRIGWVVFLDYLMGTWHLLWKVKAGYVQCRRTSPLRGSLLAASGARFGPSALKVRSFWMDYANIKWQQHCCEVENDITTIRSGPYICIFCSKKPCSNECNRPRKNLFKRIEN